MDFPQRPNVHIILNYYNRVHPTFKYTYIVSATAVPSHIF